MNSKNVPPCPRSQVSGCLVASDNDNYKDSDKSTEFAARALTIAKCFLSNDQQRLATRLRSDVLIFASHMGKGNTDPETRSKAVDGRRTADESQLDRDKWMQWEWNSNENANANSNQTVPETTLIKGSRA